MKSVEDEKLAVSNPIREFQPHVISSRLTFPVYMQFG